MADAHTLLEQYIAAHSKGEDADPREWLERLPEGTRARQAGGADRRLPRSARPCARGTRRPSAPRASRRFAEQVNSALYSQAGNWPAVLPALREKARLKRSDLVARLAAALGVQDKEEKVGSYYHEMEQGLLPSEGVDDKVLDALGSILGQSGRGAAAGGEAFCGGGRRRRRGAGVASFARTATRGPRGRAASSRRPAAAETGKEIGRGRPPLPRRLSASAHPLPHDVARHATTARPHRVLSPRAALGRRGARPPARTASC